MDRAFSTLTIRSVSEDQRVLEGIASTPRPDRVGDVVESDGAVFDLPLPLLLDHNHTEAIGEVEWAEATPSGIKFRARVFKIAEEGEAKALVDKAWHFIKAGLRKTVSIGFRPLKYSFMDGGGVRYSSWEWLELSAVSVPAQPDAKITATKTTRAVTLKPTNRRARTVQLDPVARAGLNGTLSIKRAKPGLRVIRTGPKVVRLSAAELAASRQERGPTRVVRLNALDRARAKHRVVKL